MKTNTTRNYLPPVDQLLTYGKAEWVLPQAWPDYLPLGLGPEHVPDLILLATDEELMKAVREKPEYWATIHAWRALGQLHAESAVVPLLSQLDLLDDDDDWGREELADVFEMIGSVAMPALTAYIADASRDYSKRITVVEAAEKIVKQSPDLCPVYVTCLMEQLEQMLQLEAFVSGELEDEYAFTGFLVSGLTSCQAREAIPLIKRAFAADRVDMIATGDWEDVQVRLGLITNEEAKQIRSMRNIQPLDFNHTRNTPYIPPAKETKHPETQKKSKRKRAQRSKKRQRK